MEQEDETMSAQPFDQAPPFWDSKIEWKIPRTAQTRKAFEKITSSWDHKQTQRYLNIRFQKELKAHKSLRKQKQKAYALKAAKRTSMSEQRTRNIQQCVMSVATIRKDNCTAQFHDLLTVQWNFEPILLLDQEPIHLDQDSENQKEDDLIVLLHFQTPIKNLQHFLRSNAAMSNVEQLNLRIKSCAYEIMSLAPRTIQVPRRGEGKGTAVKPIDIDQSTGHVHPGVLLLRTMRSALTPPGCDFNNSIDAKCSLCRQVTMKLSTATNDTAGSTSTASTGINTALTKPGTPTNIKFWTARDKRGDRQIARKIAAKAVLDANKDVPCPRGCASCPTLAPITKRTRTIHWSRVYGINKKKHDVFVVEQKEKHKEKKHREREQLLKYNESRPRTGRADDGGVLPPPPRKRRTPRIRPRPVTAGCSKTDQILKILGDHASLTEFQRDRPYTSRIVGTHSSVDSTVARIVLKNRIRLTTGAILLQQKKWRRDGQVELFTENFNKCK